MMAAMQQAPRRHVSCVLAGHVQHNRRMPVSFAASMATIPAATARPGFHALGCHSVSHAMYH